MDRREELIQLAGQVINGIMSSDSSVISKILDRSIHSQVAETAVSIAKDMQEKIDEHFGNYYGREKKQVKPVIKVI